VNLLHSDEAAYAKGDRAFRCSPVKGRIMTAKPAPCDLLIRNAYVVTADAKRSKYPTGAIAINGRDIVAVGSESEVIPLFAPRRIVDAGGSLVHPGFVDMHYHATFHMVGKMIAEVDTSKEDPGPWVARQYTGLINAMGEEEEYANALLACLDMVRNGVTCFMDPGTALVPDTIAAAAESIGIRASVAEPWLMDQRGPQLADIDRAPIDRARCMKLLGSELWRNKDRDSLIRGHVAIFGMGAESEELALAAKHCAEAAGAPFTMHQSQSVDDTEFDDRRFGKHVVVHLFERGILGRNCVFAHMDVLRPDEYQPVIQSGLSLVWSINAWYYGTRLHVRNPMPRLHREGANVTMGLDVSKAGTFGCGQIYTNYLLARDQGDYLSPDDLLAMHTINGARAMQLEDRLGSIESGKRADIVIRTNAIPEAIPIYNLERQHLLVAGAKSIDTVIVNGRIVIKGGHSTLVDENVVYELADRAAQRMRQRAAI
jgi:5-methylthioadenosine/S-adenosylhomocysteine deaminase